MFMMMMMIVATQSYHITATYTVTLLSLLCPATECHTNIDKHLYA